MFKNMILVTPYQNKTLKTLPRVLKKKNSIKLVFNSFKTKNYFSYKNPIPNDFKFSLINEFTFVSHSSSYFGQSYCCFKTRIEKNVKRG